MGQRVILPASFDGGNRATANRLQDSMTGVRKLGKPDLFITFVANPRWREVQEALLPGQSSVDRPDIVARVFRMKLDAMLHDLINDGVLGRAVAHYHVIEFQKRGLPHAHILLILHPTDKLRNADDVDTVIRATIPDERTEPELYQVVSKLLMHGPCGNDNVYASCMHNRDRCSKG